MRFIPHQLHEQDELWLLGPPHPGEIIRDDLIQRAGLTLTELARHLKVSRSTLSALVNKRGRVSFQMAAKLGQAFGTGPLYWLVIQAHYDAWHGERAERETQTAGHIGTVAQAPARRRPSRAKRPPSQIVQ